MIFKFKLFSFFCETFALCFDYLHNSIFIRYFNKVVPLTTSQNYLEKALLARIVNTGFMKNDAATKSVSPRAGSKVV